MSRRSMSRRSSPTDSSSVRTVPTACPLDCPDACSLLATVEADTLVSMTGDHRNPLTAGFICAKVRGIARHVHGARRLRSPAVRVGPKGSGELQDVTWDEALDRVATGLADARDRFGGEAILPLSYGGSNGAMTEGTIDARLFRRLGASELARTVCAAPSGRAAAGLYGRMVGVGLTDYPLARLIVIWGFNPSASGIHLVPLLKRAQASGAKLIVIDPRRTQLAKRADLHLPVRPGTDLVLALAVIRWLFEHGRHDPAFLETHTNGAPELRRRAQRWTLEAAASTCGLPQADIERFAQMYADATPAVIRCGWGLERNRNGGSAVAAVLALPAVAGKFGVRGGGFTMSNSRAFPWDLEPAIAQPVPAVRTINMNRLGHALTELHDPKIAALFVYNCNPLATMPDQNRVRRGLARDDLFTVVFDQVGTDTSRFADVVLPATTFLEHDDLKRGYGAAALLRVRPVISPVGQARSNPDVFAELVARLGLEQPQDEVTTAALEAQVLDSVSTGGRWRAELFEHDIAVREPPVLFVDVFPDTPDARVDLCPEALDAEAQGLYRYRDDPGGPLALISPASAKTISSTLGNLLAAPAAVSIHPQDAGARSIADGQAVRVFNDLGEVRCHAAVTADVRPGVVSMSKGLWAKHTANGATANALVPADLADLGGGATFNDARVDVAPMEER